MHPNLNRIGYAGVDLLASPLREKELELEDQTFYGHWQLIETPTPSSWTMSWWRYCRIDFVRQNLNSVEMKIHTVSRSPPSLCSQVWHHSALPVSQSASRRCCAFSFLHLHSPIFLSLLRADREAQLRNSDACNRRLSTKVSRRQSRESDEYRVYFALLVQLAEYCTVPQRYESCKISDTASIIYFNN